MRPLDPQVREQLAVARRPLGLVVAFSALGSVLLIAQAWLVTELILAALRGSSVAGWALGVVGVFAVRAACGFGSDVAAARAGSTVVAAVRRRVVGAAVDGRLAGSSGAVAVLASRGAAAVEPYLTRYVPAVVLAMVLPFLTVVAMAVVDPMSGVVVLATLPLIPVFGILVGLATRDRAQSQWRSMADLSGHFLDVMRGLPTLVAFRRAHAQSAVIRAVTDRYRRRTLETLKIAFASSAVLELVATISVAMVAVSVGLRLANGDLSLERALVVLLLAPEAYWPLRRVGAEFHAAAEGVATFEAVAGLPAYVGRPDASLDAVPVAGRELTVTYPGRSMPALYATFALPDEGVTAIVGPSGSGKSTLLGVLAGLVEPTGGWVSRPPAGKVAWMGQRPVFVAGSIADNLRLGKAAATDDELWSALRMVALAERVREVGLDAPLGEDGLTLSAGERARLALARVVVSDRHWVLLDEPTAHLDSATEQVIADVVADLARTRAVVVVAHRPALVAHANHVVGLTAPAAQRTGGRGHTSARPPSRIARPESGGASLGGVPAAAAAFAAGAAAKPASIRAVRPSRTASRRMSAPAWSAGLLGPSLLGGLASSFGVALTATAGWLIVKASYQPAVLTLLVAIVGVRFFGIGRPALRYVERLRSHDIALRMLADRRVEVYDAIVPLVPGRMGRRRGDVLTSVVDDVDAVLDRELRIRLPLLGFGVVTVLAVAVAALLDPVAGIVVAVCLAVGAAGSYLIARLGSMRSQERSVAARALVSERVTDVVQAATEIRVWQAGDTAVGRVGEASRQAGAASVAASIGLALGRAWALVVSGVGVAVMALSVSDVGGPMLALLVLMPLALAEPMSSLAEAGALVGKVTAAEARIDALLAMAPAVTEPGSPRVAGDEPTVTAEHVDASWGDRLALRDLDLTVKPGEKIAITGPSGSGKSTLAALLLRFLDPVGGDIELGAVPLREQSLDDVRRAVGLVDDDPHVFASTVAENVRFARPGASDASIEEALRGAHLGGWLDGLPEGLATRLGDGYASVSGGERARLAIARSLLAEQPVLVLDEPTAHLDHATADELAREVLEDDGRSVVWITHSDVGLDLVDRVVALG